MDYTSFFARLSQGKCPRDWQAALAGAERIENRLIRIPTGFGKTLGVLGAWLWNRHKDKTWPRRLVWCLPMRVLVEQTQEEVRAVLTALDLLWDGRGDHAGKVGIHLLMGGSDSGDWHLYPEEAAVLIGTQDMLLSRALNRGYGAARARWPMDFGLLNQDVLWVMDEIQLMDIALATSGQLQAFRDKQSQAGKMPKPAYSWWMSATLQREWLNKSPEMKALFSELPLLTVSEKDRQSPLWEEVEKECSCVSVQHIRDIANRIAEAHAERPPGSQGPTIAVLNQVDRAMEVFQALQKKWAKGQDEAPEIRLIHSRYRPKERESWRTAFLNKAACQGHVNLILITTQVIEAGVDISTDLLLTELAPWASLVQRFGRSARWGGAARVIILDSSPKDDKASAPYTKAELDAARVGLSALEGGAPKNIEAFENRHPDQLADLYPFAPLHLLLWHELLELFDTAPDLTGADVDISRFIRTGEERDVHVFWSDLDKEHVPAPTRQPTRDALCSVPFLKARDWLCGKQTATTKSPGLKKNMRAWSWDWLDGQWTPCVRSAIYPGQTILVDAACGGYCQETGWTPKSTRPVITIPEIAAPPSQMADATQRGDDLSHLDWKTIATHGQETGELAKALANALVPDKAPIFEFCGTFHDGGKAHPCFQHAIAEVNGKPQGQLLAKAPPHAWKNGRSAYAMKDGTPRDGFRHELASTLLLFAWMQKENPRHRALLGPWQGILEATGMENPYVPESSASLPEGFGKLSAEAFNLAAYLICAHHGKIRVAWHASPQDQRACDTRLRIRGIRDGDPMPGVGFHWTGQRVQLPPVILDLSPATAGLSPKTGMSWTERVLDLLDHYGPFQLAWFETILRAADQRTSAMQTHDPRLSWEDPSCIS